MHLLKALFELTLELTLDNAICSINLFNIDIFEKLNRTLIFEEAVETMSAR